MRTLEDMKKSPNFISGLPDFPLMPPGAGMNQPTYFRSIRDVEDDEVKKFDADQKESSNPLRNVLSKVSV